MKNETKDNHISAVANFTDIHPTNKGVTKLTFEVDTSKLDGRIGELANLLGNDVMLGILPPQVELDTDDVNNPDQSELDI